MSVLDHVVAGLASGAVYGLLGAALLLGRRATGAYNVAQAGLATLSAYICLTLTEHGWAFWPAFGATVVLSFALGALLHAGLVRQAAGAGAAAVVVLTAGLLLAVNGLDAWIWGRRPRAFPAPFSAVRTHHELTVVAIAAGAVLVVRTLVGRTRLGLGLRAATLDPLEARRSGISAATMQALAWGLAASVGAVAGMLAATLFPLTPNLLRTAILYGFASALIGGLTGGLVLGVGLELLAAYYVPHGAELRPAAALAVVLVVLWRRR
jgi:branched-chain amino acid transport system permease protein